MHGIIFGLLDCLLCIFDLDVVRLRQEVNHAAWS